MFPSSPNLSLSIDLLLTQSLSTLLDILIRRWCVLFISVQWLIRSLASGASVLHPQEHDRLADQHSDGGSSHAKSDTNQDGYQDDFEGGPKDHVHTVGDTFMVMMVAMTMRLELDVGWELHGTIWKTVGHSMLAWAQVVVRLGLVVLMAHKLVEAPHTETLHLVAGALGRCFGLGHSRDDLGKETAHGGFTFGIWRVWIDGNGLDGVKEELQNVSFGLWRGVYEGSAYCSILLLDYYDFDIVDADHLTIETHNGHYHSDKGSFINPLFVVLHTVGQS